MILLRRGYGGQAGFIGWGVVKLGWIFSTGMTPLVKVRRWICQGRARTPLRAAAGNSVPNLPRPLQGTKQDHLEDSGQFHSLDEGGGEAGGLEGFLPVPIR